MSNYQSAGAAGLAVQDLSTIATPPAEWTVYHSPGAAAQPIAQKAAGSSTQRHVCKAILISLAGTAAQAVIAVRLRDGATGAGTILWEVKLYIAANTSHTVGLSDLNIVGSAATAMTLEFEAATAANVSGACNLSGYTVGGIG